MIGYILGAILGVDGDNGKWKLLYYNRVHIDILGAILGVDGDNGKLKLLYYNRVYSGGYTGGI